MPFVGDYSWARPTIDALKGAEIVGVMRYLGPGNHGRDVTRDEVDRLHAGGLGVGLVWETTTTAALAGFKAGFADVDAANRYADQVGYPDHLPIFYAVDTDVTSDQIRGPVADTFHGAIEASRRPVRPYGEFDVLEILCGELCLMPCGWQCTGWSRGRLSGYRCMYQLYPPVLNQQVDLNTLGPMPLDFLWHPEITYAPVMEMESDMPNQDEFNQWIEPFIQRIERTVVQIQDNLAQLSRDIDATDDSDADSRMVWMRNDIAEVLKAAQAKGDAPGDLDVDKLAATVAQKLKVVSAKTNPPSSG